MSNSLNWNDLRPWNGSQHLAFEELCCQLAGAEDMPNEAKFVRKGTPDAGVECFWQFSDGSEHGWQAKFFQSPPDNNQWQKIDYSVENALDKHPKLSKYTVCLPIDRPDAREDNKKSCMDRWNERVGKWKKWASERGMSVVFPYWGHHEIGTRLALDKHAGRRFFWFNEEYLSQNWLEKNLAIALKDAGPRYTKELNVELPISKVFDALGRSNEHKVELKKLIGRIQRGYTKTSSKTAMEYAQKELEELDSNLQRCMYNLKVLSGSSTTVWDIDDAESVYKAALNSLDQVTRKLKEVEKELKSKEGDELNNRKQNFNYELHNLRELESTFYDLLHSIKDPSFQVTNQPSLLVIGNAGTGKTHLFCDIASKRITKGGTTLLLLGQHFIGGNTWSQIISQLGLPNSTTREMLLGALEAAAQASGNRALIMIDALNESENRKLWLDNLAGMLELLRNFPWVGIAISVRKSYQNIVVTNNLIGNEITLIEHMGFGDCGYEAIKKFFQHYHIQLPSVPFLEPEFSNPLFLKIFCEGLQKKGEDKIPAGLKGVTSIFDFFLNAINTKLARDHKCYDSTLRLVQKTAYIIAKQMATYSKEWLTYDEADNLIKSIWPHETHKMLPLKTLISEGLFSVDRFLNQNGSRIEGVKFCYQRFSDYVITSYLLDRYGNVKSSSMLTKKNSNENKLLILLKVIVQKYKRLKIKRAFKSNKALGKFIKDKYSCWRYSGLVEALSVQIPEWLGCELVDLVPRISDYEYVQIAFVDSLIWREPRFITSKTLRYINNYIIHSHVHTQFLDTLLAVASLPYHPYNADFLHKHLIKQKLADRDTRWSTFLHYQYGEKGLVDRLIDWAWSCEDKSHIADESILLSAKAISWFLTSCNRFLRDSATKALISLLENRIEVLPVLLKDFEYVNDPYVYERLFAVAYGCTLRSQNCNGLVKFAEYVYETIFNKEYVYPHILLRDYARGVIEYSLHLGLDIDVDPQKIRPPYKSDWFDNIPTYDEIKQYRFDYKDPKFKDYYWAQNSIISSMQPEGSKLDMYGDFGRYVFQSGFRHWDLNAQELSNLAIKRIFELGYDVEKHGEFDRNINRYYDYHREGRKPERIGKKYQWIAFYELLARVSDNFVMYEDTYSRDKKKSKYNGPWEPYVRDIDPTILIKHTGGDEVYQADTWWFQTQYEDWSGSYEEWIKKTSDLPEPAKIIEVNDHQRNKWLALEVYPSWEEPVEIGQDKYEHIHKYIWYQIRSYIAKEEDYEKIVNWCKEQHFMGRWLPESRDLYQLYSREYFWSPAYSSYQRPYYYGEKWRDISERRSDGEIGKVMIPTEGYLWEEGYDCSKADVISFFKPNLVLFEGLNMRFGTAEGELVNKEGECICFDPSVNYRSPTCLIIRKDDILSFLQKNKLKIFWTVLGEKWVRGVGFSGEYPSERLEFSGVYTLDKGTILGTFTYLGT